MCLKNLDESRFISPCTSQDISLFLSYHFKNYLHAFYEILGYHLQGFSNDISRYFRYKYKMLNEYDRNQTLLKLLEKNANFMYDDRSRNFRLNYYFHQSVSSNLRLISRGTAKQVPSREVINWFVYSKKQSENQ